MATGFTSQIAHAGGPPFQMWVMPRQLPRDVLVGTSAIFFAALNWIKVPAYVALGQFTQANAIATLVLLPVAILASLAGVRLVRKVPAARFYTIIYVLMVQRSNFPNSDASEVRRAFQQAAADALEKR